MNEVFEVIKVTCYDYDIDVDTHIFSTYEKAKEVFDDLCETARLEAEEGIPDEDRVIDSDENFFDAYFDGRAIEWEVKIELMRNSVK